jgi:hypothetical protein
MNKFNVGDKVEHKISRKIGRVIAVTDRSGIGAWFYTVQWSDGKTTTPQQSHVMLYQNRYTTRG